MFIHNYTNSNYNGLCMKIFKNLLKMDELSELYKKLVLTGQEDPEQGINFIYKIGFSNGIAFGMMIVIGSIVTSFIITGILYYVKS